MIASERRCRERSYQNPRSWLRGWRRRCSASTRSPSTWLPSSPLSPSSSIHLHWEAGGKGALLYRQDHQPNHYCYVMMRHWRSRRPLFEIFTQSSPVTQESTFESILEITQRTCRSAPMSLGRAKRNFYHHNYHEVAAMKVELESEAENTRGKVKPKATSLTLTLSRQTHSNCALNRKNSFKSCSKQDFLNP